MQRNVVRLCGLVMSSFTGNIMLVSLAENLLVIISETNAYRIYVV